MDFFEKYTPGSLQIGDREDLEPGDTIEIVLDKDGGYGPVANVLNFYDFPCADQDQYEEIAAEALQLARLFSAAPDMHAAILALKKVVESGIEVRFLGDQLAFGEVIEKCRLALEKAEGGKTK